MGQREFSDFFLCGVKKKDKDSLEELSYQILNEQRATLVPSLLILDDKVHMMCFQFQVCF